MRIGQAEGLADLDKEIGHHKKKKRSMLAGYLLPAADGSKSWKVGGNFGALFEQMRIGQVEGLADLDIETLKLSQ